LLKIAIFWRAVWPIDVAELTFSYLSATEVNHMMSWSAKKEVRLSCCRVPDQNSWHFSAFSSHDYASYFSVEIYRLAAWLAPSLKTSMGHRPSRKIRRRIQHLSCETTVMSFFRLEMQ